MKTTIQITINHAKPLPEGMTDILAERAYNHITAKGGQAGDVTAEVVDLVALPVVEMGEPS